jgi:hypothetical protein
MAPDAGTEPPNPLNPPMFFVAFPRVAATSPTVIVSDVDGMIDIYSIER